MIELNQIIQGDNSVVLQSFPDECIALTLTSPPYDNFDENWNIINGLRTYNGYTWNFPELARQLYRVTKPGGVVVWVVGDSVVDGSESGVSFRQALFFKSVGFRLHDTMIYEKANYFMNAEENRYIQVFEYMFIFSKGAPAKYHLIKDVRTSSKTKYRSHHRVNSSEIRTSTAVKTVKPFRRRTNIWSMNVGYTCSTKDKIAYKHPAIFPETLAEDHIRSWSTEGDTVLDPFCGSGTTLKAAAKLRRNWIGIEISAEYIEIAKKRADIYEGNEKLFMQA